MSQFESSVSSGIGIDVFRQDSRSIGEATPDAASAITSGDGIVTRSKLLEDLFRDFETRGVRVLLWKGAQRIDRVLAGEGDVDLLVAEGGLQEAESVLIEMGFRRIATAPWRHQPHVYDWFAIDGSVGRLLHVQLYEKLVIGPVYGPQVEVPGYEGRFESVTGHFPPVAPPAEASVFRMCQAAFARPWTPGRSAAQLLSDALELSAMAEEEDIAAAASLFSPGTATRLVAAFSTGRLRSLRRQLRRDHRSEPRAGGASVLARMRAALAVLNRRTLKMSILPRREVRIPAPIVAVIGSDGSGKSTLSRDLVDVLGDKFDVRFVYFGTGDGPGSILRWPLVQLRKLLRPKREGGDQARPADSGGRRVPSLARALWAMAVARERWLKMKRARRAARRGWIVVTDRYPQAEVAGVHDGPRLGDWLERGGLSGMLARWEDRVYRSMAAIPPDLVLHLDVSLGVAAGRRPDEEKEELERRIEVARELELGGAQKQRIDADRPYREVLGASLQRAFELIEQ